MRLHSARPDLLIVWYLPVILIYSAIVIFLPQFLLYFSCFNTFLLIISILVIITPLGNVRFGNKKINFVQFIKQWLIILLFEIGLSFFYFGTQAAILNRDTLLSSSNNNYIWTMLISNHWQQITLYPWTLCAILTVIMLWTFHKLQYKPATFGCGLKPIFNKHFSPDIIISIDFFFRSAFVFFIITTTAFSLIACLYCVATLFHISITNQLILKNVVIFIVIQQLILSKRSKTILAIFRGAKGGMGFGLFVFTFFFISLFFVLNYLINMLATKFSVLNTEINLPAWIHSLSVDHHYLLLFAWAWLFAMSIGSTYYFAKITEGWRVRTIIMSMLFLPLMINIIWIILIGDQFFLSNIYLNKLSIIISHNILSLISFGILIIFLTIMKDINDSFRLSLNLKEQHEKLILTNLMRGIILGSISMTFLVYLGLQNFILMLDIILILPCVTLVFMAILAYFKSYI